MTGAAVSADRRLDLIVQRVLETVAPELILLYGSRAWGQPRDDSDYDLLVVVRGPTAEPARAFIADKLSGGGFAVDVLTCTVEEYERRQHDPGLIQYKISRDGRSLYTTGRVQQSSPPSRFVREHPPREGVELWIQKAEADFGAAEQLMTGEPRHWDVIAFHAQQYVEKALKALIASEGKHPDKTHSLTSLLQGVDALVRDERTVIEACTMLGNLYPRTRYPNAGPSLTADEGRAAIEAARRVRELLRPALQQARQQE